MIFNSTYFERSILNNLSLIQINIERNELIELDSKTGCNLYFVKNGSLKILDTSDGDNNLLDFGYKNLFITSTALFDIEKKSLMIIEAIKKSELYLIRGNEFLNLIESSIEGRQELKKILISYINTMRERELDLLNPSPFERYKRIINRNPQLFQEIPQKYIAEYLNMTPETFSKIKNKN